jgi:hypothetical protein
MSENNNLRSPSVVDLQHSVAVDLSRKQLEIPPGDVATTHRQVCDYLKACQFSPSTAVRSAIVGAVYPERALRSIKFKECVAREMLTRFTAEFFQLTPEVRDKRLKELVELVAEFPQLKWRLNRLRLGVSIRGAVPSGLDDPSRLASSMADVFLMSPEAAARAGRNETVDCLSGKSAVQKKRKALFAAAQSFSIWARLQPPCGLTLGQRLDRMTARPKHLRPAGDLAKIGILLVVILLAFSRIVMTRPAGGGRSSGGPAYSYRAPTYQYQPPASTSTPPLLKQGTPDEQAREALALVLGKDRYEEYLEAKKRHDDATKRIQEAGRRRPMRLQPKSSAARDVSEKWKNVSEQSLFPEGDLQDYWNEQKARTDRVLNGNPYGSDQEARQAPPNVDAMIPLPGVPEVKDPAQQVDEFLDALENPQRGAARP